MNIMLYTLLVMASLTLEIPKKLKTKIARFHHLNWSAIAIKAFMDKLEDIDFLDKFKSESQLTEEGALSLGAKISASVSKKYK